MYSLLFSRTVMLLLLVLFSFMPTIVIAEEKEPTIEEIIITTSSTQLLLFATVKNCFTDEMLEGVRNAIPLTFRFDIVLDKVRNNWFDVTLVEKNITHIMTYDAIKKEYKVVDSNTKRFELTRSEEKAKELMAELSGIEIIAHKELLPDAPYALEIKATLVENILPLGMHYILPFTSFWNFETDWRTIEFRY